MTSLGRKTLAKTINRFKYYREYQAFLTWRKQVEDYRVYRQKIQYTIIKRLQHQ